mgnify:CR=1 FL=1
MNIFSKEILKNFKQGKHFFLKNTKKIIQIHRKKIIFLNTQKSFEPLYIGNFKIKIAETKKEVKAAQALRYKVFFQEKKAKANLKQKILKRDYDFHDKISDHLIIVDKNENNKLIGTYRLLRGINAKINNGYYSENEFDLSNVKRHFSSKSILELGRSCVHTNYRSGLILKLLWYGIAKYIQVYDIKLMIGCASFSGVDIKNFAEKILNLKPVDISSNVPESHSTLRRA